MMQYRTNIKNGDQISLMGFGCMRFSKDEKDTERQILKAVEKGINYFDTAYIYPKSEVTLGRIVAKNNLREKIKIATKLPHYLVKKYEDLDKFFNAHLERLQTDYIDYYLIHMLSAPSGWQRMVDMGIADWIAEKKRAGKIINLGFSFHGGKENFQKIVDMYPWDFCMIQYNFQDENNQAGKAGLQYATQKGIPVMVMEPLRGGKLVNKLPKEAQKVFDNAEVKRTNAQWALKWVFNHSEVLTVLSGMNSLEMVEENCKTASETTPNSLSEEELETVQTAKEALLKVNSIPCTGCNYCMPCPFGVDIPMCFNCYNDREIDSKLQARFYYIDRVRNNNASKCTQCGKCEQHCPQNIPIRKELQNVKRKMEGFIYKPMKFVVQKFMRQR